MTQQHMHLFCVSSRLFKILHYRHFTVRKDIRPLNSGIKERNSVSVYFQKKRKIIQITPVHMMFCLHIFKD